MDDSITYELSDLDKLGMRKTVKLFIFYELQPATNQNKVISSLIEGVKNATAQLPFMAGGIQVQESGKVCIVTNPGRQIQITTRQFKSTKHKSFPALGTAAFHPNDFDPSQLLPEEATDKMSVCALQLSLIEGGLVLGFSMNHAVGDWTSINTFLSLVCQSGRASYEGLTMPTYTADLNRAPYNLTSSNSTMSRMELQEKLPSFYITELSSLKLNAPPTSKSGLYKIRDSSIQQLKVECTPFLRDVDYISSYDCISALIWMATIRARLALHPEKSKSPSRFIHPIDVRTRDPENTTSERYFGNAVIAAQAGPLKAGSVVSGGTDSLALVASCIRKSISSVDISTIGYMNSLVRSISPGETMASRADFADMDLMMSSWYSGMVDRYCIGGAISVVLRVPAPMAGTAMILPNASRAGMREYEVLVGLVEDEHDVLRTDVEFLKYFEIVA
ncbi:hypothetical protein N7492_004751 [Penicillium capsulatum]|uniref:Transferase n=1 Tax=Penicillium capsulatum TaxID=69766 RepID=A0A9W9IAM8_9EURO|nr:hypothetical protein N7492_004751 [Penicillium capsulatum]KAJ6136142.1 hypothetical protein N7512_001302 [Penicillium capsulatum]